MKISPTFILVALAVASLAGCVSPTPAPVVDHSTIGHTSPQAARPGYHTVKKGETLYGIALENGQDYRDIAAWNYITDPYIISIDQVLRVQPPEGVATATTAPVIAGASVEQRPLEGAPPSPIANTPTFKREPRVNKEPYSDALYASMQKSAAATPAPAATSVPAATTTATTTSSTTAAATPAPASGALVWAWPANGKVVSNYSTETKGIDIAGKAGDPVLAAADGKVVYTGSGLRGYGNLVIIKHSGNFLTAYAHNQKILVKEQQEVKKSQKIAEMGKTDSTTVKLHFEVRRQGDPVEPLNYLPKK
ncbi:MAG: peptidoglycan DD-metalloendopeptidase family protein [Zoogloeaceae bacterium]|jgi:lipoprotein NlpD|nr:peptidoglycan DD-metalloendopeptidase family protein [Zoogloeaceae bacterium]